MRLRGCFPVKGCDFGRVCVGCGSLSVARCWQYLGETWVVFLSIRIIAFARDVVVIGGGRHLLGGGGMRTLSGASSPPPPVASLRSALPGILPQIAPGALPYISWAGEACVAGPLEGGARRSAPFRTVGASRRHASSRIGFLSGVVFL